MNKFKIASSITNVPGVDEWTLILVVSNSSLLLSAVSLFFWSFSKNVILFFFVYLILQKAYILSPDKLATESYHLE